jgi:hypothetical protein
MQLYSTAKYLLCGSQKQPFGLQLLPDPRAVCISTFFGRAVGTSLPAAIAPRTGDMQLYLTAKYLLFGSQKQPFGLQLLPDLRAVCISTFFGRAVGASLPAAIASRSGDMQLYLTAKNLLYGIQKQPFGLQLLPDLRAVCISTFLLRAVGACLPTAIAPQICDMQL